MSLFDFVDGLLPFSLGENDSMRPAKFAARMKLFLSKTVEVAKINSKSIRWVPDITELTLTIGSQCMEDIAKKMELGYTPSERHFYRRPRPGLRQAATIRGSINGIDQTWTVRRNAAFRSDGIEIPGREREVVTKAQMTIVFWVQTGQDRHLKQKLFEDIPDERLVLLDDSPRGPAKQLMTDGVGAGLTATVAHD